MKNVGNIGKAFIILDGFCVNKWDGGKWTKLPLSLPVEWIPPRVLYSLCAVYDDVMML